jgi:hypothetical protein
MLRSYGVWYRHCLVLLWREEPEDCGCWMNAKRFAIEEIRGMMDDFQMVNKSPYSPFIFI